MKPILKYPGNKTGTAVVDRVRQLFEPYRQTHWWVEPFVGAGGMLLGVQPTYALCSDLSPEIVGLHRWIQDGGRYVDLPAAENEIERYLQRRLRFRDLQIEYQASPDLVDDLDEFFSLLVWLNKACFNGLWRVNGQGLFNVPEGKDCEGNSIDPGPIDLSNLNQVYQQAWIFNEGDFESIARYAIFESGNKFVYADPPYFGTHSAYTGKKFTWDDQKRLAHWLAGLDCPVVTSNSDHLDIADLYRSLNFTIEHIQVRRSISCNGGGRQAAIELLAYKGVN